MLQYFCTYVLHTFFFLKKDIQKLKLKLLVHFGKEQQKNSHTVLYNSWKCLDVSQILRMYI
jgi:hypothetical protein